MISIILMVVAFVFAAFIIGLVYSYLAGGPVSGYRRPCCPVCDDYTTDGMCATHTHHDQVTSAP